MIRTVVKLGGSLERAGLLAGILPLLADVARAGEGPVVVPGGGRFADAVREACARRDPGADAAHWAAAHAMDQLAHLLAGWTPGAALVTSAADAQAAAAAGRLPILAPCAWLRREDPLPHSWDVTADSIAAWVARRLGAGRLVLVKSVPCPEARPSLEDLARRGVIDAHLPSTLAPGIEWRIVDGHDPERLGEALRSPRCSRGAPPARARCRGPSRAGSARRRPPPPRRRAAQRPDAPCPGNSPRSRRAR